MAKPSRGTVDPITRADIEANGVDELVRVNAASVEPTASGIGVTQAHPELVALKARIDAARDLKPLPSELHCLDCFQRGRDAAIRLITGT